MKEIRKKSENKERIEVKVVEINWCDATAANSQFCRLS
jgi:hypothetical protein